MRIVVKFNTEELYWNWVKVILEIQEKQGFINVIKRNNWQYDVDEPNILNYGLVPEWIKEVIEDESGS